MPSVTNYQCPNCGAPLRFDPDVQKLVCDACGNTYTAAEIDQYYKEKNEEAVSVGEQPKEEESIPGWSEEELSHLKAYTCPSCGAALMADENTAATSCPYCGNNAIIPAQLTGRLKPDYIIPFRRKKEDAVQALTQFYGHKPFLPRSFKEENHIEDIKGVYVPFWLYNGTAQAQGTYNATRTRSYSRGDDLITETDHFILTREGSVSFTKVPADASGKMPDDFMDAIEPFDYKDLKPFEMGYLTGYLADRYDVTAEDDAERVQLRMENSAKSALRATAAGPYQSVVPVKEQAQVHVSDIHYAFLPVWMLATRWQNKVYLFTMNGQTGEMIGDDLPIDKKKAVLTFILIAVITGLVLYIILRLALDGGQS